MQLPLRRDGRKIETTTAACTAVITDKGRIAADTVVVAMGSFTAPLLAKIGIRVPIYPGEGRLDHLQARRLELLRRQCP